MALITVTSSRRRIVMAVLLCLAACGAVIRHFAPDPSVLRDVGTLLLVLWLPAIGNLISYFVGKVRRKPAPPIDFPAGAAFAPQLQVRVEAPALPAGVLDALDPAERRCTLLVGRLGFTVRLAEPVVHTFATPGQQTLGLEILHPAVALRRLAEGTDFHLVAGMTGVAKGRVVEVAP